MEHAQQLLPALTSTKPARPTSDSVKQFNAILELPRQYALAWSVLELLALHARSTLLLFPTLQPALPATGATPQAQIWENVTLVHAQLLPLPLPARSHSLAVPI